MAQGFIRPEVEFSGLPQLLDRIKLDVAVAQTQLAAHDNAFRGWNAY